MVKQFAKVNEVLLHRATARLVPCSALETPAVIAHGQPVVLGGGNHRLHEEVITAGGLLREGRFVRMNVGEVRAALDAALPDEPSAAMKQRLADLWPAHVMPLRQALEARMWGRTGGVRKALEERAEKEVVDMTAILTDLQRSIRTELAEPEPAQLELWTDPEREQLERNKSSLCARLESIPTEIVREADAIRARCAHPTPRLFPDAVTYLVPEKLARAGGR